MRNTRRAFSILEVTVASLIVSAMFVAAMSAVGASGVRQLSISDRTRGQQLGLDLMNEILQQSYQDPTTSTAVFGPEGGNSASNRSTFNDVDDYNGWTESPPQDRSGNVLSGCAGWSRSVVVEWADASTLAATTTTDTGVKKIAVTVKRGMVPVSVLVAYRTIGWTDTIPNPIEPTSNRPPVAAVTAAPLSGKGPLNVSFSGSASSDLDGNALSYVWNFGDGTRGNGATVSHSYSAVGSYTATLTVYDGFGGVSTAGVTIGVTP